MDYEQIARSAVSGRSGIAENTPVKVRRTDKSVLVNFRSMCADSKECMHDDSSITVMLDKETGKVKRILIGVGGTGF